MLGSATTNFQDYIQQELTQVALRLIHEYEKRHGEKAFMLNSQEEAARPFRRRTHSSLSRDLAKGGSPSGPPSREVSNDDVTQGELVRASISQTTVTSGFTADGGSSGVLPGRARGAPRCGPNTVTNEGSPARSISIWNHAKIRDDTSETSRDDVKSEGPPPLPSPMAQPVVIRSVPEEVELEHDDAPVDHTLSGGEAMALRSTTPTTIHASPSSERGPGIAPLLSDRCPIVVAQETDKTVESSALPDHSHTEFLKVLSNSTVESKMARTMDQADLRAMLSVKRTSAFDSWTFTKGVKPSAKWLVDPRWLWYRAWMNFMSIVVVFSTFFAPLRYGFAREDNEVFTVIDGTIDGLFAVDILLRFNTAMEKATILITDRRAIALDYVLSSQFWIDVLATVPVDMLWVEIAPVTNMGQEGIDQVASALGLLRLLRINRILIFLRALQKNTNFNLLGVVIGKFLLFILLCTHTSGCIFYGLARVNNFGSKTWIGQRFEDLPSADWGSKYIHALYWAVGTFKAGPASGQLGPVSISEMILACLAMLVNICLQTYLVSSMAALLTTADVSIYAYRNRLRQLAVYAERKKLPNHVREQIAAYMQFRYSTNEDLEQNVLGTLPELFRQRVSHALYEDLIENLSIFAKPKKVNLAFLWQIHGALVPSTHMPHHDLVNMEEPATHLYILADGEAVVHYHDEPIELRGNGEELTSIPFICKMTQPYGVRTTRVCSLLNLDHASWDAILTAQPEDNARVNSNVLRYCQKRLNTFSPVSIGYELYSLMLQAVRRHLLHHQQRIVSTLCYAAAGGDLAEMSKYLIGGNTADCSDYDARSPLHIASANGQVQVIELLIRKHANINGVDNFGRTPLLEACRSRQLGAARELRRHGATLGFSAESQMNAQMSRLSRLEKDNNNSVGSGMTYIQLKHVEASELCVAASDPHQLWYLKALLEFQANVNASDYDSRSALHVASAAGNQAAVDVLLKEPTVNVNLRDNFGRTPLMEAIRHKQEPCARLLQARRAEHGLVLANESAPNAIHAGQELCQAAFTNNQSYLISLIEYCRIDIDTPDYDLRTALMLACAEGNSEVAINLVHHSADIYREDRWGHTPLTEARTHGHEHLADLLERLCVYGQLEHEVIV